MKRFSTLGFRLSLFILIAIVPVLIITLYTAAEDRRLELGHIQGTALQLAQVVSDEEEQVLAATRQLLVALAQLGPLPGNGAQERQLDLASLLGDYTRYANLGVIDLDGNLCCSAVPTSDSVNVADRSFFQRALSTKGFVVGGYALDPVTKRPCICFGYPILDEAGEASGVVYAALDLGWLNGLELSVSSHLPQGSTLDIIDGQGTLLAHVPDPDPVAASPALDASLVQMALQREQGATDATGRGDASGIYAFASIPSTLQSDSLHVIIGYPSAIAFDQANRTLVRNLLAIAAVTALALATARVWGRRSILQPVGALVGAAKRVSSGDLSARAGISSRHGELSQLGRAFDQMAAVLEERKGEQEKAAQALQHYGECVAMLHRIDGAILGAESTEAIAQAVVSEIRGLVPCSCASVVTLDQRTGSAATMALCTREGQDQGRALQQGNALPIELLGDMEDLRRGEVRLVNEISAAGQGWRQLLTSLDSGARSWAIVPLISREQLVGTLNLGLSESGAFGTQEAEFAREVADSLAVAIQNAQLLEQVLASQSRLQQLSVQLLEAQETERRTIARELHDEIGQALTAVKINLQAAQQIAGEAMPVPYLQESIGTVERTLQQVRDLSLDLRPSLLDDLGLVPALRWLVARQARQAGPTVKLAADAFEKRLPPNVEIACFRVVQESLTNMWRHSQARNVHVELHKADGHVELTVTDDGVGFDVQAAMEHANNGASMGLLGMRERVLLAGGDIDIRSRPGTGTEIRARFPLASAGGAA